MRDPSGADFGRDPFGADDLERPAVAADREQLDGAVYAFCGAGAADRRTYDEFSSGDGGQSDGGDADDRRVFLFAEAVRRGNREYGDQGVIFLIPLIRRGRRRSRYFSALPGKG